LQSYGLTDHESLVHLFYFIAFNAHGAIVGVWASVLTAIALHGGENKFSENKLSLATEV
jgi:hypothetical protein